MSKALRFTRELSFFLFFLFYQYTVLSSRAVDGHQMYSGCKASNSCSSDLAHPSPNFNMGVQKVRNLASFSTSLAIHSIVSRPRV